MEEAKNYFREEGIETFIQEATQHERCPQTNGVLLSKWPFKLLGSSSSSFLSEFNKIHLLPSDPLFIIEENIFPESFKILFDYQIDDSDHLQESGGGGWLYSESFESLEWKKEYSPSCYVRKRKIQRLLVGNNLYFKALSLSQNWKCKYRTIHPQFIANALKGYSYKIEFVIEYQRFFRDRYDSYNLTYADPAHWNYALSVPPLTETKLISI